MIASVCNHDGKRMPDWVAGLGPLLVFFLALFASAVVILRQLRGKAQPYLDRRQPVFGRR
ncbi:MAG: hypothetical protein ACLFVU_07745 [Phycisphaerae bacterium]